MREGHWEGLTQLMNKVALLVDVLRPWFFLCLALAALVLLVVWIAKVLNHLNGNGPGFSIFESYRASLLDRMDEHACVAISRRPRRRKRRHRHRPATVKISA